MERLRDDILSGKYKPGDRLNESSIAREFGISRIPVREALFELRESGLVVSLERRGMFVTSLSEEEVQKLSSVRAILETEALLLARAHMTPEIASALGALVNKMETESRTLAEAAAMDLEFHRMIWAASRNDYLQKLLDPLATVLFAQYTLERMSSEQRRWRLDQHRALLSALLDAKDRDLHAAFLKHQKATYLETESPGNRTPSAKAPGQRAPSRPGRKPTDAAVGKKRSGLAGARSSVP